MAVNWFEGGRRVATLLQALVVLGCLAYVGLSEPNDEITIETRSPDAPFVVASEPCDYLQDARHDLEAQGESIVLCYRGLESQDGTYGVPYAKADKPGMYWLADDYSDVVKDYVKTRSKSFVPTTVQLEAGRERANQRWWTEKKESLGEAFKFGAITLLALWIFSSLIGWIARGFAGIPSGADFRIKSG